MVGGILKSNFTHSKSLSPNPNPTSHPKKISQQLSSKTTGTTNKINKIQITVKTSTTFHFLQKRFYFCFLLRFTMYNNVHFSIFTQKTKYKGLPTKQDFFYSKLSLLPVNVRNQVQYLYIGVHIEMRRKWLPIFIFKKILKIVNICFYKCTSWQGKGSTNYSFKSCVCVLFGGQRKFSSKKGSFPSKYL